jgi:YgiT-type zinc finger domain-containing protein
MKRCPICKKGTRADVDDIDYAFGDHHVIIKGERCTSCGEEFFGMPELERIARTGRRLGMWGSPMRLQRKLSRSGRGTVLRIPVDIEQEMKLKGNERVTISKAGKRKILIEIE